MEIEGGGSALLRLTRRLMERRIINGASSDDDDDTEDSDEYTEQSEKDFDGDDLVESPSSNEHGDVFIAGVS